MKLKLLIICLLVVFGLFVSVEAIPTAKNISGEVEEIKLALEEQFDCSINSSNYSLIGWHQKLVLGFADNSKNTVSEEDAKVFLTSTFPSFIYLDTFELD